MKNCRNSEFYVQIITEYNLTFKKKLTFCVLINDTVLLVNIFSGSFIKKRHVISIIPLILLGGLGNTCAP